MFAYCGNDPVNRIDESGKYWFAAATGIIGFIVGGISQIAINYACGKGVSELGEGVMGAAFGGGAYGLATGFGVNPLFAGFIGACVESLVTGTIASCVSPTTLGPKDTVELLTQGAEMSKAWGQSIFQSSMVVPGNIGNTISNRYLAPKKTAKPVSGKTSKNVHKPSSRRSTRPMALKEFLYS